MELKNKVVLITGGGMGIGRAAAHQFSAVGSRIVIADVDSEAGQRTAEEVGGQFVQMDVSQSREWARAVELVMAECGGIDVAYLNAGVMTKQSDRALAAGTSDLEELSDEEYLRVIGVNLNGVVFGIRAVVPSMASSKEGAIVISASMAAFVPVPFDFLYALSKHAIVGVVRSLAPQLAQMGITINAVCPGGVATTIADDRRERMHGLGLVAERSTAALEPQSVAELVVEIAKRGETGDAWLCARGLVERHFFPDVYRLSANVLNPRETTS